MSITRRIKVQKENKSVKNESNLKKQIRISGERPIGFVNNALEFIRHASEK
jgi:hypothetical protein